MLVRPIFVVPSQMSIRSPGCTGPDEVAFGARENQARQTAMRKITGQLAPVRPSRLFHVREIDGVVDVAEQIAVAETRAQLMAESKCGHQSVGSINQYVVSGFSRTSVL